MNRFRQEAPRGTHEIREEVFEEYHEHIVGALYDQYGVDTSGRAVMKSSEVGSRLPPGGREYRAFLADFARAMESAPKTRFAAYYCMVNKKDAPPGGLKLGGTYGSATRRVGTFEFVKAINPYFPIAGAWNTIEGLGLKKAAVWLDGMSEVPESEALTVLTQNHKVEVFYNGDKTIPSISTCDMLCRHVSFELASPHATISMGSLKKALGHDTWVDNLGPKCHEQIRPRGDPHQNHRQFAQLVRRPTVFYYGAGQAGQAEIFDQSPKANEIYRAASGLRAGVKSYDPRRDKLILAALGSEVCYFSPLNSDADQMLEMLKRSGYNIKPL